jgi:hypothetical protein
MSYSVLTNTGFQDVSGIRKSEHQYYYKIKTLSGLELSCTEDHIFETLNGPITAKMVTKNDELIISSGNDFIKSKRKINKPFIAYDLVDVENGSLYYTNNILSHNCSFLGSSNTLINSSILQTLVFLQPIIHEKHLKIYEQPIKGHNYVTTVDVCAGLSQDSSVVNVIDVTEAPYKQVLVYKNCDIDPTSFSVVVESIAKKYNYSTLIIESNNDGKIVAKELWDMEYENLISTQTDRGGNNIKSGKRSQPGIMMTKLTKKIGCSKLKDLIETNVLIITNDDCIEELGTFAASKGSYEAESGKHDDIVMCLVMFAWFTSTNYFEDISGTNAKKLVSDNRDDEDIYTLLGFINDGDSNDFYFEEIDTATKKQNSNDDIDMMNFW